MSGANFSCRVHGDEGSSVAGCFNVGAAALFAIDEAEDSGDGHARFACGFDGSDGGTAGRADVIDDDYLRAFFEEAFDLASGAVGFFGFANQEPMDESG